jgi:carbamate kinase
MEESAYRTGLSIAPLLRREYSVILTHGNGPQVGEILLQNEIASTQIEPSPLDVCVAESQGLIGHPLLAGLERGLKAGHVERSMLYILTRTVVDERDSAFSNPQKPIGPLYTEEQAAFLEKSRGWRLVYDERGGFRRVVPSPEPLEVVEADIIAGLFRTVKDLILIAGGGGGIPVVRSETGYRGVEAVIDKDLTSELIASKARVDDFIIITDVDGVYRNFAQEGQERIATASAGELRKLLEAGEFGAGSMLPKVLAAVRFVEKGGRRAIITNAENLLDAVEGNAGTIIRR